MKLTLERWDTAKKGKFESSKLLQQLRDEGYSCSTYTFPAGCSFGDHSHAQDKKDAILAGEFLFRMDGEEVILKAGDTLEVPKGHTHYAEVVGGQPCVFVDASR
ncbi:hypothetical protein WJX73_009284 [Symbiochloris irregularis]|uniref:Cupin type-2 domain-containing protein n=1 Tax=Symbiochloris irregularis TaxID=706552 RepID=A0AAW1PW75_9CHLO